MRVELTPDEDSVVERRTVQLSAKGFDDKDTEVEGLRFAWISSDEKLATVDDEGLVTSLRPGVVRITANVGDVVGEATITITASKAASIELRADTSEIPVDGEVPLEALVKDAEGYVLLDREVVLESADETLAVIKGNVAVVGVEPGETEITGKLEGLEASIDIRVVHRFTKLFAGGNTTCGLTAAGRAWCWGQGNVVGSGVEIPIADPLQHVPSPVRVAIEPGIAFKTIAIGQDAACALTPDGETWCWGDNYHYLLGRDWEELDRASAPLLLADRSFAALSAMGHSVCGLDEDGFAHCWGYNSPDYELGVPDNTEDSKIPLAVSAPEDESAPVAFTDLRSGYFFSCGLTSDWQLYCWGYNRSFSLGDGTEVSRARPVKPMGNSDVSHFSLGDRFACATTKDENTYCWGYNSEGQAIFGLEGDVKTPTLRFEATTFRPAELALGVMHGCALDLIGKAFCWGDNRDLKLGRKTEENSADIGEVAGDRRFTQLVSGDLHTCGLATDGKAYCWGRNQWGQLGIGNFDTVEEPTEVFGQ